MTKTKPIHELRLSKVKAAIFENPTKVGIRYSVNFSRLYKKGDAWGRSQSFGRDDLPLLMKLADQVHTYLLQNGKAAPTPSEQ